MAFTYLLDKLDTAQIRDEPFPDVRSENFPDGRDFEAVVSAPDITLAQRAGFRGEERTPRC